MKQKFVIQLVGMSCEKTRAKAMQLAAGRTGVISMQIAGDGKDRLEVIGVDVDPVCLVYCLRKKLGHAQLLQVEEVKEKKPEEKKPEEKKPAPPCYYDYYYHHRPPMVVNYGEPSGTCGIMYSGGYW